MAVTVEIVENSKGLQIHSKEPPRVGRIAFEVAVGLAVALFFYRASYPSRLTQLFVIGLVIVAIVSDVIAQLRGTNVELTVTNLDLTSTGHAPGGYKPSSIARADIYSLKFDQAMDGDFAQPSGLYAEHYAFVRNSTTCILPSVDKPQTEQVIEAIFRRFPDTTFLPPLNPNTGGIITLNLNKPAK